jgi:hypothetical protein
LNAAAAKAKSTKPNITWREAGPEIERCKIDVTNMGNYWCADCPGKSYQRMHGYGDTALEAVENLLREIGGVNG